MKTKTRKLIVLIGIAIVALAIIILATGARRSGTQSIEAILILPVQGPLQDKVSASGTFQAERYSVVASQTYGIVQKVYVKPGDHVEKGDLIVVVDEREARESLASAEIAIEEIRRSISVQLSSLRGEIRTASIALDQAKRAQKTAESMKAVKGIPEEDFWTANETLSQAQATLDDAYDRLRVAQGIETTKVPSLDPGSDTKAINSSPAYRKAKLSVESARRVLDGCIFRADISGTVTEMGVAQGDRLKEETIVARIEDPESVTAEINVDEVDIRKIREGMKVEVTADFMLGETFEGTVIRIWPIVKSNNNGRVCLVRIAIKQDGKKIILGASCMARIVSTIKENTLTLPATALIPGADPAAVWVAVKQSGTAQNTYTARRREIKLGESTVNSIEILSGLTTDDLVIADQVPFLTEGAIVINGND